MAVSRIPTQSSSPYLPGYVPPATTTAPASGLTPEQERDVEALKWGVTPENRPMEPPKPVTEKPKSESAPVQTPAQREQELRDALNFAAKVERGEIRLPEDTDATAFQRSVEDVKAKVKLVDDYRAAGQDMAPEARALVFGRTAPFVDLGSGTIDVATALKAGVTEQELRGTGVSQTAIVRVKQATRQIAHEKKVQAEVGRILAEDATDADKAWQVAVDKLHSAGFVEGELPKTWMGPPGMAKPKQFTIPNMAEFVRNNPDGMSILRDYNFTDETLAEVGRYNQELKSAADRVATMLGKGTRFSGNELALGQAIQTAGIIVEPLGATQIERGTLGGLYKDDKTGKVLSEKEVVAAKWNALSPEQKLAVAALWDKDYFKGSYFAEITKGMSDVAAQAGIVGQIAYGAILPVTMPVAKQITLEAAKAQLADNYKAELSVLSGYVGKDGAIDMGRLNADLKDDKKSADILQKTGYENADDLKSNLEYYNYATRVTPKEWATAGLVGALDIMGMGMMTGAGAGVATGSAAARSGLTTVIKRGVQEAVPLALFGVTTPDVVKMIASPNVSVGEKVLGGVTQPLLLLGAVGPAIRKFQSLKLSERPDYVPLRSMSDVAETQRVWLTERQYQAVIKAGFSDVDIIKAGTTLNEQLVAGNPKAVVQLGPVKISLKNVRYQQAETTSLFHATPDGTLIDRIGETSGETPIVMDFYMAAKVAIDPLHRSYTTGVKATHPYIIEVKVTPEQIAQIAPQRKLLGRGGLESEAVILSLDKLQGMGYRLKPISGVTGHGITFDATVGPVPIRRFTLERVVSNPSGLALEVVSGKNVSRIPIPRGVEVSTDIRSLRDYSISDIAKIDSPQIKVFNLADATDIPGNIAPQIQEYIKSNGGKLYGSFVDWLKRDGAVQPHDIDVVFKNRIKAAQDIADIAKKAGYDAKIYDRGVQIKGANGEWVTMVNTADPASHLNMMRQQGGGTLVPASTFLAEGIEIETLGTQLLNQAFASAKGGYKAGIRGARVKQMAPTMVRLIDESADSSHIVRISKSAKHSPVGAVGLADIHGTTRYQGVFDDINSAFDRPVLSGDPQNPVTWHWVGEKQDIIILGDSIDRGPAYEMWRSTFNRLHDEAKVTGGKVRRLLGNHELAYLSDDAIAGIKYTDAERSLIKKGIQEDILAGHVTVAAEYNGKLYTHAGVSRAVYPEFVGKPADFAVSSLNEELIKATRENNFSSKTFAKGRVEKGPTHSLSYNERDQGGPFWLRPQEATIADLDLGYTQVVGHTPNFDVSRIWGDKFVTADVGRRSGGRGTYIDTPILKTQNTPILTESIPSTAPRLGDVEMLALRIHAMKDTVADVALGWHGRVQAIENLKKSRVALIEAIKKIDAEIKVREAAGDSIGVKLLQRQKAELVSPTGSDYLYGGIGFWRDIIMGRRDSVKITDSLGKVSKSEIKAAIKLIESNRKRITEMSADDVQALFGRSRDSILKDLNTGTLKGADLETARTYLKTKLTNLRDIVDDGVARNIEPYLDRGILSQRYAKVLDDRIRLQSLAGARYADISPVRVRDTTENVHTRVSSTKRAGDYTVEIAGISRLDAEDYPVTTRRSIGHVGEPQRDVIGVRDTRVAGEEPVRSTELRGNRGGISLGETRGGTLRESESTRTTRIPERAPAIRGDTGIPSDIYRPRPPGTRISPPRTPVIEPPPRTPPPPNAGIKLSVGVSSTSKQVPDGSIAWQQGVVYKYSPPPWNQPKPITLRHPPIGFVGNGTPSETVQIIGTARNIPSEMYVDLGFADITVKNGREIYFKGQGLDTNVGTRIGSPTTGMSVLESGSDNLIPNTPTARKRHVTGSVMPPRKSIRKRPSGRDKWYKSMTTVGNIR